MAFQERFVQDLSKLTYRQRAAVASNVNKTISAVDAENFAKQLLTHPATIGPEIVTEEGFTDVLPAPSADISKCYHSHFAGLQIAASAHVTPLLVTEVKSNSQMFKQFAINHVVKQTNDDGDLEKLIYESVPNVKLKLLHTCIKERRVALLDRMLPALLKTHGIDFVAGILHGCSKGVVEAQLQNVEMRKSNSLRWAKICHSHAAVVISLLQKSLQAQKDGVWDSLDELEQKKGKAEIGYLRVWHYWEAFLTSRHALDDLLFKAGQSSALLGLLLAYPCYSHLSYWPFPDKIQDPLIKTHQPFVLPALPHIFSANFAHFVKRHPQEMTSWLNNSIQITVFELLQCDAQVKTAWEVAIPLLPFDCVYQILEHVSSSASPNSFYMDQNWKLRSAATKERVPVFKFELSFETTKRDYELSQFHNAIQGYLTQFGPAKILGKHVTFELAESKSDDSMEEKTPPTSGDKLLQACQMDDDGPFFTVMDTRINVKPIWGAASEDAPSRTSLDRITFSKNATYWGSLTSWSKNQINKLINLGFDTLDRLNDNVEEAVGATEHYKYREFCLGACVDFGVRAIKSLTTEFKAPAPEIRTKTGWQNKYFECVMLVFDRLTQSLLRAREGYMSRLELLESIYQDVSRALKNYCSEYHVKRQENYSDFFAFALNRSVRTSWEEIKDALTKTENWYIPLNSVQISISRRLDKEKAAVRVFYNQIGKLLAAVNTDKLSATQAETALKRSLEFLVSIRPQADFDLDLWKTECVEKFWARSNQGGKRIDFPHRVHMVLDSKISLLQSSSWKSSWRRNFDSTQTQLASLVRELDERVAALMQHHPLKEVSLRDSLTVLNRRYFKECPTPSSETEFVSMITDLIESAETSTQISDLLSPHTVPNVIQRVREFWLHHVKEGVKYPWWKVSYLSQLRNSLVQRMESELSASVSVDMTLLATVVSAATDTELSERQTEKIAAFVMDQIETLQPTTSTEEWRKLALRFYKRMFTKFTPTLFPFPDEDPKITENRKFELKMLRILVTRWTKLLQERWRRGLDNDVTILRVVDSQLQQFFTSVKQARKAEKERMRDARKQAALKQGVDFFDIEALQLENDKKEERPEDDFDDALEYVLRSFSVSVSINSPATKVQRVWERLQAFLKVNMSAKDKYALARGEAWSSACFAPLLQLATATTSCLCAAVTKVASADINMFDTLMSFMAPMHLHPLLAVYLFDNLLPVFTQASPPLMDVVNREKAAGRTRWDSAIQEFVLEMLALLEKYKDKANKRVERDQNILIEMQKKNGTVAMPSSNDEKGEVYPSVSVISDIQTRIATQTVQLFAPVSAHHIKFLTTVLQKAPFENDESFASCYGLIAQGQPVENLPDLVELLLQVGKSNNANRWELVFRSFSAIPEPVKHLPHLLEVIRKSSPIQQLTVFKSFETAHLLQLSYSSSSTLISLFDALHSDPSRILPDTRAYVSEVLVTLLPQVSSETRDQLLKYQDINLCRKALEFGTNSNSWSQRCAGLRDLLNTSLLCSEKRNDNLLKTLKFFSKKIKNESPENREQALVLLLGDSAIPSWLSNTEYLPILLAILSDCLESLDVGKLTASLDAFTNLSKKAIDVGATDAGGEVFNFGVEIQWRICLHRLGDLKASQQFRIVMSATLKERGGMSEKPFFTSDKNAQFVAGWLQAYKSRVEERAPDWLKGPQNSFPYLQPLASVLGNELESISEIQKFLSDSIAFFQDAKEEEGEILLEALRNTSSFFFVALKHFRDWRDFKSLPRLVSALCSFWQTLNAESPKAMKEGQFEAKSSSKSDKKRRKHRESREDLDSTKRLEVSEQVGTLLYTLFSSCVTNTEAIENVKKRYNRFYIPIEWQDHPELNNMAQQFLKLIETAAPRTTVFPDHSTLEKKFLEGPMSELFLSKRAKWFKCGLLHRYVDTVAAVVEGLTVPEQGEACVAMHAHAQCVFTKLMKWQPKCWWQQASAARLCRAFTRVLQSCPQKDSDGLLLLNSDNMVVHMFEEVFREHRYARKHWLSIPPLNEYVNAVLRSRQAGVVVWRWIGARLHEAKTPALRFQSRDACVSELLSISKSAVHLRIVWRHLTSSRQDLLDKYLNPDDPFYGVFFVEPSLRISPDKATASSATPFSFTDSNTKVPKHGGRFVSIATAAKQAFDQEEDKEQALSLARTEWLAKNPALEGKTYAPQFDHEDLFRLPTYFHLRRLLPDQCLKLGMQFISEGLNKDRPQASRKQALARWTMLPSTTYSNIIAFLKEMAAHKLPRNLVEVLTRGCMCNDDMIAPLHYLLSPALLSSDSAKVAAYAISSCIPRIPESVFTKIIENLLSKGRRHTLKVTVVKEIVRLLIKFPTAKNISMMIREWRRPALHRDIRITVLKAAFKFLDVSREVKNAQSAAWQIFASAVEHGTDLEVLTSIVCAHPASSRAAISATTLQGLTTTPRILEHIDTLSLSERSVQLRHCGQFGRQVILPLIARGITPPATASDEKMIETEEREEETDIPMTIRTASVESVDIDADMVILSADGKTDVKEEAKGKENKENKDAKDVRKEKEAKEASMKRNEDVAYLAIAALPLWAIHGLQKESCEALKKVIVDFSPHFVNNKSKDTQKINNKRWKLAVKALFRICGITSKANWPPEAGNRIAFVVEVLQAIISHLVSLLTEDRDTRSRLVERVEWMMKQLPQEFTQYYSLADELCLMNALEEHGLFWKFITKREVLRLSELSNWGDEEKFNAPVAAFLVRLLMKACEDPLAVSDVRSFRTMLFPASRSCPSRLLSAFLSNTFPWISEGVMNQARALPSFPARLHEIASFLLITYPTYADESPENLQLTLQFFASSFLTILNSFSLQPPEQTLRISFMDLFSTFVKLCTKTSVPSARALLLIPIEGFLRKNPGLGDNMLQWTMFFSMVQTLILDHNSLLLRLIPHLLVDVIREIVIRLPEEKIQQNSFFEFKPISVQTLANKIENIVSELMKPMSPTERLYVPPLALAIFQTIKTEAFSGAPSSPQFRELVVMLASVLASHFIPTLDTLGLVLNWEISTAAESDREAISAQNMGKCVQHVKAYFDAHRLDDFSFFRSLLLPNENQHSAAFPFARRRQFSAQLFEKCPVMSLYVGGPADVDEIFQLIVRVQLEHINELPLCPARWGRLSAAVNTIYTTVLSVVGFLNPSLSRKDPVPPAAIAFMGGILKRAQELRIGSCDFSGPQTLDMFWFEVAERLLQDASSLLCNVLARQPAGLELIHAQCVRRFEWLHRKHNATTAASSPFQPSMSCFRSLNSHLGDVLTTSQVDSFFEKLTHELAVVAQQCPTTELARALVADSTLLTSMDADDMISLQSYLLLLIDKAFVPTVVTAITSQIALLQPDWKNKRELHPTCVKIIARALQLPLRQASEVEVRNRHRLRQHLVLEASELIALAQPNRFDSLLREAVLSSNSPALARAVQNFVLTLTPFLTQHQTMHTLSVKVLLNLVAYALGDISPETADLVSTEGLQDTPPIERYRMLLTSLLSSAPHLIVHAVLADREDGGGTSLLVRLVGRQLATAAWKQGLSSLAETPGLAVTFVKTLSAVKAPLGEPCSPICRGEKGCVGCLYALGEEVPISAPRGDPLLQDSRRMCEGQIMGVHARRFVSSFITETNKVYGAFSSSQETKQGGSMREGVYHLGACHALLVEFPQLSVVALDSFLAAVEMLATWGDLVHFRRRCGGLVDLLNSGCEWLCTLEKLQQAEDQKSKMLSGTKEDQKEGSKKHKSSEPKYSAALIAHIVKVIESLLVRADHSERTSVSVAAELRSLALSFLRCVGDQSLQHSMELDYRKDWHPQLIALLSRFHADPNQMIRLRALRINAASSGTRKRVARKRSRSGSRSRSCSRSRSRSRSRSSSYELSPEPIRTIGGRGGFRGRVRKSPMGRGLPLEYTARERLGRGRGRGRAGRGRGRGRGRGGRTVSPVAIALPRRRGGGRRGWGSNGTGRGAMGRGGRGANAMGRGGRGANAMGRGGRGGRPNAARGSLIGTVVNSSGARRFRFRSRSRSRSRSPSSSSDSD